MYFRSLTTSAALAATLTMAFATVQADDAPAGNLDNGKKVANDRGKGNCVACHHMADAVSPGSIGPPLVAMQTRYETKEELAKQIWDATVRTPDAAMPPFGRHKILTEQEFNDVVEYIWSL